MSALGPQLGVQTKTGIENPPSDFQSCFERLPSAVLDAQSSLGE
jgi:hypothetical protein